ncbi:ADP-ribosylglycohydrolase family protein [Lacisediminimonas profundi]|uniref:ADP-ribosylglycohydrolase family protein n=1 Tax=Lacisediminimonas profundi TaxID=2603856 RepID=UPI00124B22CF|nr:ADP-ribosylglycohydrolase family protein [Lacisediminimonas profundi]
MTTTLDRFRGCLLGLACGDAVGTTVEFRERGTFKPVKDMTGGGPFSLQAGEWTDDTSMALCLAASLTALNAFDPRDQMERYCRWMTAGYMSSNGSCFDIGTATRQALFRFQESGEVYSGSTNPRSAGNGCLMRLAPVPMFFYSDLAETRTRSVESARTTHGASECLEATDLFAVMLHRALHGQDKKSVLEGHAWQEYQSPGIRAIAQASYLGKAENEIRSSGYVVESLEAALWCFATTQTFEDAILKAANLGGDADTVAAICGQVAGAHYGASGIPQRWIERLVMKGEIGGFAEKLCRRMN